MLACDLPERELSKRYTADYRIAVSADQDEATWLLADDAEPVALLLAGFGGQDPGGLALLAELGGAHRSALRVAVVGWGDWATAEPVFEAVTVGAVDSWLTAPQQTPDEEFHSRIPHGFYESGSTAGQELLTGLGLDEPRLPVVEMLFSPQAQALQDPTDLEIAEAFGLTSPLDPQQVFDVAVAGAARRGWAPPSTPRPRGWPRSSWRSKRSAARPGPAR